MTTIPIACTLYLSLRIRNITARFRTVAWGGGYVKGAISTTLENQGVLQGASTDPNWSSFDFFFNANIDDGNYGNNMAGHAVGPDIHPYSIYMVPLITY